MAELLSDNPVFKKLALHSLQLKEAETAPSPWRIPLNLIAYDGSGRLFVWNSADRLLHCVDIETPDDSSSRDTERPTSLACKKSFKTLRLDTAVNFQVRFITFNRMGLSLILAGDEALMLVDLRSQVPITSASDSLMYKVRAKSIGGARFQGINKALRILQVTWHPYSDTHVGVMSSDGVLRLFDLSLNAEDPEQEYHIQSRLIDRSPATYARPVAFSFGGDHLWDRFAVFILFSDGSVYALCPISPFGSVHNSPAIEEIYKDACQWASSTSTDLKAVSSASCAAVWLETVFPSLVSQTGSSSASVWKAVAHVPFNSSLRLQGPLPIIMGADISGSKSNISKSNSPASMLMYSTVGKDSILALSFRDGQMHIYALADELQPVWNDEVAPRVQIDEDGYILSVGMLVETSEEVLNSSNPMFEKNGIRDGSIVGKHGGVWSGQLPPLLQLAVIDFALPANVLECTPLSMLADPVVPERLYCHHAAGIDAILLQWLPFSQPSIDRASSGKPPTVYPMLDTCPRGTSASLPLLGVTEVLDPCGETWLVAVTASCDCAVIAVKSHLPTDPLHIDGNMGVNEDLDNHDGSVLQVISKELLQGPRDIPIPQISSSGRSLTPDSIEGKELLHDHWKLLHEKHIEYAHRVHVELRSHGHRLHKVVQDQQRQLSEARAKMTEALEASGSLNSRIEEAFQKNKLLKERVRKLSSLLTIKQKPLTTSEEEYKTQLDVMRLHDVDILHSAVDVLKDRLDRHLHISHVSSAQNTRSHRDRLPVPDAQLNRLKAAVNELTQVVEGSVRQIKRIEDTVKKRELLAIT